jgi:hypothetical protein
MPDDPKPDEQQQPAPAAADTTAPPPSAEREKEIGDFITRHVLEKDSVFFEG